MPIGFRPVTADGSSENIAVTSTSQQSAAMPTGCNLVRICLTNASADAFVEFGTNPTVTATTGMKIINSAAEYLRINSGEKIAVIGTDGDLNITPITL